MKVVDAKETESFMIYVVSKYGKPNSEWHVSVWEEVMEFKCSCCSCLRMESFGIPCEHIVVVLVFMDICELPKSLVLDRWTKDAKVAIHDTGGFNWECMATIQYCCLMDWFRVLCNVACRRTQIY